MATYQPCGDFDFNYRNNYVSMCATTASPDQREFTYRRPSIYQEEKECQYCGTVTDKTNSRGNCIACGAPFKGYL